MALTKRQKANRARKARNFIGPPTLKPQHKAHQTRKANKAATSPGVTAPTATAAKKATSTTLTVAKNAPASVSGALRAVGSPPANKATAASPPKAAAAAKSPPSKKRFSLSTTPVVAKKAGRRFSIKPPSKVKTSPGATPAAAPKAAPAKAPAKKASGKGSSPGRSDAAKKAWATRRANGWKPPAKKKAS